MPRYQRLLFESLINSLDLIRMDSLSHATIWRVPKIFPFQYILFKTKNIILHAS